MESIKINGLSEESVIMLKKQFDQWFDERYEQKRVEDLRRMLEPSDQMSLDYLRQKMDEGSETIRRHIREQFNL